MILGHSKNNINPDNVIIGAGRQGIQKLHSKSELLKKKVKKIDITKYGKQKSQALAIERVVNECGIGMLKQFKIISGKCTNRQKRFVLGLHLIATICSMELV